MKHVKTIGIIGLGSFGKFVASLIPTDRDIHIRGVDIKPVDCSPTIEQTSLEVVAASDVVIVAVPLESYEAVLPEVAKHLRPEALLIDVCSVKVKPEQLVHQFLPGHRNILLTHPLFGPLTEGRKLIVTECTGELAKHVIAFCEQNLSMELHYMSSVEHDETMAQVHVLSFFIARGLSDLGVGGQSVVTPTYKKLMELVDIDRAHSEELFMTVQQGNPFAEKVRQQVVASFTNLEQSLRQKSMAGHV